MVHGIGAAVMSSLPPLPTEPAAPTAAPASLQPKVSDAEMDKLFADLGVARSGGTQRRVRASGPGRALVIGREIRG